MNFNKYKYILPVFMASLLWIGCTDELEKLPPQSLPTETALSTDENVKQVLNGAYNALSFTNVFGGELMRNAELLAADGEIIFSGTFGAPSDIWRKEMTTINSDVSGMWLNAYEAINIANNVLTPEALDVVDPADRAQVEGEARFIRGILYFELVKFFGLPYSDGNAGSNPGVPLVDTPTQAIDESSFVSRSTVQQVYDFAEADLIFAAANLPAFNGEYANSVAANAVLARLYLQKADYNSALGVTNTALNAAAGNYAMTLVYQDAFNRTSGNSFEDVFSVQVSSTDGSNAMQTYYGPQAFGGRGDIEIEAGHLDFYDPADLRLAFFYLDPTTGETRAGKWQDQFANVTVIRLAELYLIRAECNVRLGSSVGDTPENDLDRTRNRAGLGFLASPTLNDVFLERKLELAQEGHAVHDFKRTQGDFYLLAPAFGAVDTSGNGTVDFGGNSFSFNADKMVYPIPDREITTNENLTQNPGYGG